jgi:hypothetical protein
MQHSSRRATRHAACNMECSTFHTYGASCVIVIAQCSAAVARRRYRQL